MTMKPIDVEDYKQRLTVDQITRLKMIFPDGVCDYKKSGIEQRPLAGTWKRQPHEIHC